MKIDAEKALIAAFFVLLLWLGPGTFFQHELAHDAPYGYGAADAYQHHVRAEWVKEHGSYDTEAPQIVTGYEDVIGYYMPGASQLAAVFSHASGLESHDALYLLVFLAAVMSALAMYYGLRSYDRHVALLSLPVTTLVFAKTFYSGILMGQWPFMFGTLFLVGAFWAISRLEMKKSALLVALFITAVALTHTSELAFVVGFVGVAFLIMLLKKDMKGARKIIAAGAISAAASIYYLIIFSYTWGKQFGYHFYVERVNQGFANVRAFQDFQLWIIIIMLAGMIGIYYRNAIIAFAGSIIFVAAVKVLDLPTKITSDFLAVAIYAAFAIAFLYVAWKKKPEIAKVIGPYMLIIGYASFVGFGPRAFQTRFMWPVTLAPLFGIGAWMLIDYARKNARIKWAFAYTVGIAIIATTALVAMNYEQLTFQGSMHPERWEMFEWLQENTEEGSNVLFFYGDGYEQTSMLYNAGRANFLVQTQSLIEALQQGEIRQQYEISRNMDYGPGLPYRKGLLGFGYHLYDDDFPETSKDICDYEYYVMDKFTANPNLEPLIQYNNAIRQLFQQNGMEAVFENGATSVVKNSNPGGECIGQQ